MHKYHAVLITIVLAVLLSACSTPQAVSENPDLDPLVDQGEKLHKQYCASCHVINGDAVIVGPSLEGIATAAVNRVNGMDAQSYIEQSILEPSAYIPDGFSDLMPATYTETLSEDEFEALIAFLMTLK
jgi:mono/diheme cytochrome c family protein